MLVPVYDRPSVAEPTETQDRAVMESRSATIYRKMPIPARQLPITEFAHKARVVSDERMATRRVLAACDVAAERRRAAALDRAHHLQLVEAHMAAVGLAPSGTVVAEDVRDLQNRPNHDRRRYRAGGFSASRVARLWRGGLRRASGLSILAMSPVATRV